MKGTVALLGILLLASCGGTQAGPTAPPVVPPMEPFGIDDSPPLPVAPAPDVVPPTLVANSLATGVQGSVSLTLLGIKTDLAIPPIAQAAQDGVGQLESLLPTIDLGLPALPVLSLVTIDALVKNAISVFDSVSTSGIKVAKLALLGGLVDLEGVDANVLCVRSADATGCQSDITILKLAIAGTPVVLDGNIAPNTVLPVIGNLDLGGLVGLLPVTLQLVLNEQIPGGDKVNDVSLTVNAAHLTGEASLLGLAALKVDVRVGSMSSHAAMTSSASAPNLRFFGGPVIQRVNVIPIYWNSGVQFQPQLNAFYAAVTNSPYFDWLREYNTGNPAQSIVRGTRANPVVDNQAATTLTDANVRSELLRLFNAGAVPGPDVVPSGNAGNLYTFHFPPGVTITDPNGAKSCVVFCAYHGTFVVTKGSARLNVYYSIVPDQGGGCAGGCGGNPSRFNNLTSVSSHELIEAVTDAAVGLATQLAAPLAWYDPNNGEIGDICNAQQGTVVGGDGVTYTVQKEWSNSRHACITQ